MARLVASEGLDQGAVLDDIPWGEEFEENAPLGIVLTSTCDLEHGHADFVILAALKPAQAVIQASREFRNKVEGAAGNALNRRPWDSLVGLLEDFVHNANIQRYFFVEAQAALGQPPLLADFQHVVSISLGRARACPVLATLPSPFREQLVTHFAAYSSRIGVERTPQPEVTALTDELADPYHGPNGAP
jgi:hypothetical protein